MSCEPFEPTIGRIPSGPCSPAGKIVWCGRRPEHGACEHRIEEFSNLERDEYGTVIITHSEPGESHG